MNIQYIGKVRPRWSDLTASERAAAYARMVLDARGFGLTAHNRNFNGMDAGLASQYCEALYSSIRATLLGQQEAQQQEESEVAERPLTEAEQEGARHLAAKMSDRDLENQIKNAAQLGTKPLTSYFEEELQRRQAKVAAAAPEQPGAFDLMDDVHTGKMSIGELLETYNEMVLTAADQGTDVKPRKSFRTHADAVAACRKLHQQLSGGAAAEPSEATPVEESATRTNDTSGPASDRVAEATENAATREAAGGEEPPQQEDSDMSNRKKAAGRPKTRSKATENSRKRSDIDSMVITKLHTDGNPKRKNTDSYEYWAFYRDGMTVAAYINKFGDKKGARARALQWLRWDVKHKLVKLSKAA